MRTGFKSRRAVVLLWLSPLIGAANCFAQPAAADLAATYRFLVSKREQGGVLYEATARHLDGAKLPLSFIDTPAYWAEHVCGGKAATCAITDVYDSSAYTLRPQRSMAGDLQTERVNLHNGTNIYDAATWQIAVMLGRVRNNFKIPGGDEAYELVTHQNRLLQLGYSGDAKPALEHQYRAVTNGETFRYNGQAIDDGEKAFAFRTLPRAWLAQDPLIGSKYDTWIKATGLPLTNSAYQRGKISWTDWKPISGENAWAFLIGPLQAAYLHHQIEKKKDFVPFDDIAIQNALDVLPTFAAMQAEIGAVYYAPKGTVMNQGEQLVNPYEVAIENNFSLYAGLNILRKTLEKTLAHDKSASSADRKRMQAASSLIDVMLSGGRLPDKRQTQGMLAFFKNHAWREGEFIQGGFANDPRSNTAWQPRFSPKAVDVNTWGIAAIGTRQVDAWFGFGASFNAWQKVKAWGGYGTGKTLQGVGFSDHDGNGIDASGNYRQGIMSAEWTAGAIVAVRDMLAIYRNVPETSPDRAAAQGYVQTLQNDERSMLLALNDLRADRFNDAGFPTGAIPRNSGAYLYANKRYLIPFGWYANPLPSTCSAAWVVMLNYRLNPFDLATANAQ